MTLPRILYESRLLDGTPVASGTASGYDVNNLTNMRPAEKWQPDVLPATVTIDCGAAATVNYWGLWEHDLGSRGATAELHSSTDNFAASDTTEDSITPSDDAPFIRYVTDPNRRYYRLRFTGTTVPTIGIALLGEYLEIPATLSQGFDPTARMPEGQFNRSVKGNPMGANVKYQSWAQALQFRLVSWAWIRSTWLPAWNAHISQAPFIFSWDHVNYPAELVLVNNVAGSRTPTLAGSQSNLELNFEGLVAAS